MRELAVISGKGGTGKTSIVASLAALWADKVIADCDVDAPDLHLVLSPFVEEETPFTGGKRACIDPKACTSCGLCEELCRYDAVLSPSVAGGPYNIDALGCEGCLVCAHFCPEAAITNEDVVGGKVFVSRTRHGRFVHARLFPGAENSGKLVSAVRRRAKEIGQLEGCQSLLIDGPPGIGCPVIASITGATYALVVTEPTLSGLHDLERIAGLTRMLGVPAGVCVNNFDINVNVAREIEQQTERLGLDRLGRVRHDPSVTAAQIAGRAVVEYTSEAAGADIRALSSKIEAVLEEKSETS